MESGTSLKSRPKVCSGLAGASAAPSVHKAFYVARRRRRRSLTQFGQPYYRQPRGSIRSFPRHQVKLSSSEFNGRVILSKADLSKWVAESIQISVRHTDNPSYFSDMVHERPCPDWSVQGKPKQDCSSSWGVHLIGQLKQGF